MRDYTKGPWHCKPNANGVYGADGYAITYPIEQAITVLGSDDHSHKWIKRNVAANARLIAAAPELLEALTMGAEINTPDLMDWIADRLVFVHKENPNIDFVKSLRNRAATARAAIAKAKGETK